MTREDFTPIHAVYRNITHRDTHYDMRHFFRWQAWQARGWTEADLKLVVAYIWHRIRQGKRFEESFRFCNLIENHERFEDDLCDARAWARQTSSQPDSGRASVLRASGRMDPVKDHVVTPAQVLAGNEALKKLIELRESL